MPDKLEDSTVRLEQLLRRVTSEKDPDKCDQLGAEIWRVLSERDRISNTSGESGADRAQRKGLSRISQA